jgi:hypothetical protein
LFPIADAFASRRATSLKIFQFFSITHSAATFFQVRARADSRAVRSTESSEQAGALSAGAKTKCFLTGEVNNSGSEILFAAVTNRRAAQAGA